MAYTVKVLRSGLWTENPASVQLLGLCPLLAVSTTVENAVGLGTATIAVMTVSAFSASLIRGYLKPYLRLPIFVVLIATLVTMTELIMAAYSSQLRQSLGIFLPLIVTNCMILGRIESTASRVSPIFAAWDGLTQALGFTWVLLALAAIRETLATGSFSGQQWFDSHWLFAALPAGGFILFGLMVAAVKATNHYQQ